MTGGLPHHPERTPCPPPAMAPRAPPQSPSIPHVHIPRLAPCTQLRPPHLCAPANASTEQQCTCNSAMLTSWILNFERYSKLPQVSHGQPCNPQQLAALDGSNNLSRPEINERLCCIGKWHALAL